MLLQGGLIAAQVATSGSEYSDLIAGGTTLRLGTISTRRNVFFPRYNTCQPGSNAQLFLLG